MARTAIDVFAGAGGLSLGLELAGWAVKAAVEFDEKAMETHQSNFTGVEHLSCDVRSIDFGRFRGIDLCDRVDCVLVHRSGSGSCNDS